MKNKCIIAAMLLAACTLPMNVNAQLQVLSSGNVKVTKRMAIGTTVNNNICLNISRTTAGGTQSYWGIKSTINMWTSMPTSPIYGIQGIANALSCTAMTTGYPMAGVFGYSAKPLECTGAATIFSAGVAGITHMYGGIGVYGGVRNGSLPTSMTSSTNYAGYFDGTVKINGTILSNLLAINGDALDLNNIQSLSTRSGNALDVLQPVSYTIKQDSAWKDDEKAVREMDGIHYGLIAQDVQKVLPEIVYERDGKLGVNYIELIPLLIQRVQELSAKMDELSERKSSYAALPQKDMVVDGALLYQNNPNPFTIDTQIDYQLPLSTQNAMLYIYNINGLQVAEYPITKLKKGSVIVSAGTLDAGMYLYSLIADGHVVDTKRMILTK